MAITVSHDFTDIDQFDNTTNQSGDQTTFSPIGTNTDIFVEGPASNLFQNKQAGLGTMGHYNAASNFDFTDKHIYGWIFNLDYFDSEVNNGVRFRLSNNEFSGLSNFSEFTVGGNDTLRTKIDGFTVVTCDVSHRRRNYTTGTHPQVTSVDGVGLGGNVVSTPSGQNTAFIDYFYYGTKIIIEGTVGDSAGITSWDYTNGRGVFKDIGGVYYILTGMDFGDDATGSSDFADTGETWVFENQYAAGSYLYTLTFVANGTGTNTVDFGTGSGSGDTESGSGGNIFIAKRQPFHIVATNSNITTAFYGCSFLNSGYQWSSVQLENTNVKAISCLFNGCGPITIKNSAAVKQSTVTSSASIGSRSAVEMDAGSLIGTTVSGADRGVHFKGTSTRTVKNNIISANVSGYFFDTAQTVTIDGDTFDNTYDVENGGTISAADSYPISNYDSNYGLNGTTDGAAQSFPGDGNSLISCAFLIRACKHNVTTETTGNVICRLYAHAGTYGTSSVPTGTALASSETWSLPSFMQGRTTIEFKFSPPYYQMASGTNYCIAIEFTTGTATNFLQVGRDTTTPTHGGNASSWNGTTWTAAAGTDLLFFVYSMGSNAITTDSYSETNQNATTLLDAAPTAVGQSITGDGNVLSNVRWYLSKTGTPAGNMVCKLYAHSGTFGTSSVPTGTALATSDVVVANSLTTSLALTQFQFTDEYTLVNTTKYVVALEYTGAVANYVSVGTDTTTPTHGGNFSTLTGTWSAVAGTDAIFYVSTGGILTLNASNGANPSTYINSTFIPGATIISNAVTVTVSGLTEGTPVVFYATETVGSVTDGDLLSQGRANSLGVYSFSQNYSGDLDFLVRARNQGVAVAAIADDNGARTDETDEANNSSVNDMTLLPTTPVIVQDKYFFGHTEQFDGIKLWITTAGVGGGTITFYYWASGTGKTALTGVVDGTSSYSVLGENKITWTMPSDWVTQTVNGQGPFYYVTAEFSAGTFSTSPKARQCVLDATRYLPFNQNNTITSTGASVTAVWTEDTISKF